MNLTALPTAILTAITMQPGAPPAPTTTRPAPLLASVIVSTRVLDTQPGTDLVSLAAGRDTGVHVGDTFWVCGPEGVLTEGRVLMVAADTSAGRCHHRSEAAARGQPAVVLNPDRFGSMRDFLPESVSLQGKVLRAPPGRETAWIDLGRRHGLRQADGILVQRLGLPIARGQVVLLEESTSLVTLRLLVSNALAEAGDPVALWPGPGDQRLGRLTSAILAVRPEKEGPLLTLVGTARDGLLPGYMVDLYRQDRYVGVAVIEQSGDPLSTARLIEAASLQQPAVGDAAVVRPGPEAGAFPMAAVVFKVAGDDYALVDAGESDSVRVGERWVVRRPLPDDPTRWPVVAELVVTTVKVNHCGTTVRTLAGQDTKVLPWEWAERPDPPWPHWVAVGKVNDAQPARRWAAADVQYPADLAPGSIVRWRPAPGASQPTNVLDRPCGAGVVIHVHGHRVIFYVPPAWGDVAQLAGAQVELRARPVASPPAREP